MSFADQEARVNASVFARLTNADATPPVGDPFPVVFDSAQAYIDDNGVQTLKPVLHMQPSALLTLEQGMQLTIASQPYLVRSIEPLAEGGLQRVVLARAA